MLIRSELTNKRIIHDSSMVEHSAVNRVVAGSSPARGAKADLLDLLFLLEISMKQGFKAK